jgi:hypothetical protein
VRWNLNVVLIYISFIVRDVEHFFMWFWPFVLLPLENFSSFAYFYIESLILWEFRFFSCL